MSTTRAIEYRIIQEILRRRDGGQHKPIVEGLILTISVVACLALLAAFLPGLLWLALLGAFVLILGG